MKECEWGFALACLVDDAADAQILTFLAEELGSCLCFTVAAEEWKIDNIDGVMNDLTGSVCVVCVCPLRGGIQGSDSDICSRFSI